MNCIPLSTIAGIFDENNVGIIVLIGIAALILFGTFVFFASRYKRCPSDRILVVYGKVSGQ